MSNYFDSPAIGSSILGTVITRTEPLQICVDRATIPVNPTGFMENGKAFEDLIEQEFGEELIFDEKYFKSDLSKIPEYKGEKADIRQILDILDIEDLLERETAVEAAYIYKDDGSLHGSHKQRHRVLDQIKAHDWRRPIPEPYWKKLEIMLKRFKSYPFEVSGETRTLSEWMLHYFVVDFQVEYFWKHECGADCRAKYDMIWSWGDGHDTYAMPLDLKVTANWLSFEQNWKYKYIWQSKHYMEGFAKYCKEKNMIPHPVMWYLIQESGDPQITHARALNVYELKSLTSAYDEAISVIWNWVEAGKPVQGYMDQQLVDRWGRPE